MEAITGTGFKVRRRQISITALSEHQPRRPPPRGEIVGWNEGMARRLGTYLDNFRDDFTGMVTLTYGKIFPSDGKDVKLHLRAFIERVRRLGWFEKHSMVWFLEFQERGAPHFHLLISGWLAKEWVSIAWADISQGDPRTCCRCEALRSPRAAGGYARKYARKTEQKVVPASYTNVGRFWGCCGPRILRGLPRVPSVVASTQGLSPSGMWARLRSTCERYGLRMYDSPTGFILYGNEREIFQAWRYLRALIAPTVHKGLLPGDLSHQTLAV